VTTLQRRMGIHFGQWLRARREALGLSTRQLGDAIERSHNAVSLLERGKLDPSPEMLTRLADVLGVSTDDLVIATFPDRFDDRERELLRRWLQS
jgi:transcriptional regulator with XRE-family HTH domain